MVFLIGDRGDLTFAQVAEGLILRISEGAAKMTVTRMQQRFSALVRQELAHTVVTSAELEEELQTFAEAWRGREAFAGVQVSVCGSEGSLETLVFLSCNSSAD